MSNSDKVRDLSKLLAALLPYCDQQCVQKVSFEARLHEGEWTVHNFKLELGEKL